MGDSISPASSECTSQRGGQIPQFLMPPELAGKLLATGFPAFTDRARAHAERPARAVTRSPVADGLKQLVEHALAAFDLAVGPQFYLPLQAAWKNEPAPRKLVSRSILTRILLTGESRVKSRLRQAIYLFLA